MRASNFATGKRLRQEDVHALVRVAGGDEELAQVRHLPRHQPGLFLQLARGQRPSIQRHSTVIPKQTEIPLAYPAAIPPKPLCQFNATGLQALEKFNTNYFKNDR
jgi:hypothetical protein